MNLNPINAGVVASSVWSNAPRTLTSTYNSGYTAIGLVGLTLAAGASVTFQPTGANALRNMSLGRTSGAAGSSSLLMSNSISTELLSNVAANSTAFVTGITSTTTAFMQLTNNDVVNAVTYCFSGHDIA